MKIKNSKKTKASWKNRFLFAVLLVILIFFAVNLAKSWRQNSQINQEIAGLEGEIGNLEKDNLELKELVEYFNSDAYIEEKARVDLGLKKQGEKVVIVSDSIKNEFMDLNLSEDIKREEKNLSNPKKWLRYFLKEN